MKAKITSFLGIAIIIVLFLAFSSPAKHSGVNEEAKVTKGSEPLGGFDAGDPK
jgi:hypothetical protein